MAVDFKEYSRKMDRTLEHLEEEFDSVRAGERGFCHREKSRQKYKHDKRD